MYQYYRNRFKQKLTFVKEKIAANRGSAAYWTEHLVPNEEIIDEETSLEHLYWRNGQYLGYSELMPNSGYDNKIIVDYGCGPGNDLVGFSMFSSPKKIIGIDVSSTALNAASKRLSYHTKSAQLVHIEEFDNVIPLESNSVDLIHSSGVLHHCKNIDKVLMELYRILKASGEMQIMVYNYNSIWLHLYTVFINQIEWKRYTNLNKYEAFKHTTDGPHCPISKCYKKNEFINLVIQNGFKGSFTGASISLTEMQYLPKRIDALKCRKLPKEHREFLSELTFNNRGIPLYKDDVAGINACFRFTKL